MQKEKSSLHLSNRRTASISGSFLCLEDVIVSALLLFGVMRLFADTFPSVPYSWWAMGLASVVFAVVCLILYGTDAGRWVMPLGCALVLACALVFRQGVLAGFGVLANDFQNILTAKDGTIHLDYAAAQTAGILFAVAPTMVIITLLISRSVWSGSILLALPVLLPIYGAVLLGLLPCNAVCGLLTVGAVILLVHRNGKHGTQTTAYQGVPVQMIPPVICVGLCLLAGTAFQGNLNPNAVQQMRDWIHAARYDSNTNSMPEGKLKNLRAWKKSDTPALEVTMEKPEKVYLRGEIFEVYSGSRWEQIPAEDMAEYESLFYWLHDDQFFGQSQIGTASQLALSYEPKTIEVRNISACSEHGYYPYAVCGSESFDSDRIGDAEFVPTENMKYLVGSVPEWYAIQNQLASAQGRTEVEQYLVAEQAYADYVRQFDLQLTQESWEVLDRQLKQEEQTRNISDIRSFIRSYLEDNLTYDDRIRSLNGSMDFLQYTLERSGRGYSVHYATAATLMLRYMGVPARYVEGYFLSAEDAAKYMAGETITLTEENAHAWAEYYVSGVGFVPFEVTPGYIDNEDLNLGGINQNDENTYDSNPLKFAPVERPEKIDEQMQDRFVFSLKAEHFLFLLLIVLFVLLAVLIRKRTRLRSTLRAIDLAEIRDSISMRYGYAAALLQACPKASPAGMEEAAQLNREALFSNHIMTEEQLRKMDMYAVGVLAECRSRWSLLQKLRYRIWDCLY